MSETSRRAREGSPAPPGGSAAGGSAVDTAPGDMPPEEFRVWAHRVADWIADYLGSVENFPVMARVRPGELRSALPPAPPAEAEPMADVLRDFDERILPAVTHWNHPSFHGYFAVTGSGPGILAEMLSAALNVNAMVWRTSPAGTELEEHVLDWIRGLLGLPEGTFGVIQDTASTSSLVALAAARHRAYPEAREEGLFGRVPGRVYLSAEAHSSIEKAALTLGFGRKGVRRVPIDAEFRMDPEALATMVAEDLERGFRPVAVVGTVGTTSTASADPIARIAEVCGRFDLWLHVDSAYAGAAAMVPELRESFGGWERADSVVFNPHKWLFTPVDCSVLYARDREAVRAAFSLTPEYLRTAEQGEATNFMDYGVALGRRFRALKLWFVLRYFGVEGIRARIREHVRLARRFGDAVSAAGEWELGAPVRFSTVVFRYAPPGPEGGELDRLNLAIMERVNAGGRAFLSHTRLGERIVLRLSIGNLRTRERHVDAAWGLLQEAARAEGSVRAP